LAQPVQSSDEEEGSLHVCQDDTLEFSGVEGPCSALGENSKAGTQAKIKGVLFPEK
jgi:hypothetical protein